MTNDHENEMGWEGRARLCSDRVDGGRGNQPTDGVVNRLDPPLILLVGDILILQRGCAHARPVKRGQGSGGGRRDRLPRPVPTCPWPRTQRTKGPDDA